MFADTIVLESMKLPCKSKHLYSKYIPDFRLENTYSNFTENRKLLDYYVNRFQNVAHFAILEQILKQMGGPLNSYPRGSSSLQGLQTLGVIKGDVLRRLSPALLLNLSSWGPRHYRTSQPSYRHTWATQPRSKLAVVFATNFRVAYYI